MIEFALSRPTGFAALGDRWRELEARSECSFFQSWSWTGCLAKERFPDPVLLDARQAGATVALALFNRRRGLRDALFLGEAGEATLDSPFIEHNGPLVAATAAPGLAAACLLAARRLPIGESRTWLPRRLVLGGVGDAVLEAARAAGPVRLRRSELAPSVDLARLRRDGRDYLDGLSANTRYQVRRSDRSYAALGGLEVRRAATLAEAHAWLDALAGLHQATWTRRNRPGAFAAPWFGRFHHALIEAAFPRAEVDLLRVASGTTVFGFLYNFRHRGRALAYQSGFDYASAARHQKPGLTSHHRSILFCSDAGLDRYDFLAGGDRYKRSLANDHERLHWLEVGAGVFGVPVTAGMAWIWPVTAWLRRRESGNFTGP